MSYIYLFILLSAFNVYASFGEIYSETNYISKYGLVSDTQIRFHFFQTDKSSAYIGAVIQRQDKLTNTDLNIYDKNLVMPVVGVRSRILNLVSIFAEYRTEIRSRLGIYAGDIFQYEIQQTPSFTEAYVECVLLPSFHSNPVTTTWLKQGFRYNISEQGIFDPYLEFYLRRSPNPNLGRDTDQARIGLRGIYSFGLWSTQLLIYQAYEKNNSPEAEALFILGGIF